MYLVVPTASPPQTISVHWMGNDKITSSGPTKTFLKFWLGPGFCHLVGGAFFCGLVSVLVLCLHETHGSLATMSSMVTTASWVPRGFAAPFPTKYNFDEAEFERIADLAKLQLDDANEDLEEAQEQEDGVNGGQQGGDEKKQKKKAQKEADDDNVQMGEAET